MNGAASLTSHHWIICARILQVASYEKINRNYTNHTSKKKKGKERTL